MNNSPNFLKKSTRNECNYFYVNRMTCAQAACIFRVCVFVCNRIFCHINSMHRPEILFKVHWIKGNLETLEKIAVYSGSHLCMWVCFLHNDKGFCFSSCLKEKWQQCTEFAVLHMVFIIGLPPIASISQNQILNTWHTKEDTSLDNNNWDPQNTYTVFV